MQDSPTIENAINSNVERRMLGFSLHGWENIMLTALAGAALFAAIVGVATYCVVQLQRDEISASRDALERYKLAAGEKISAAETAGEAAKAEAAKANTAAEELRRQNLLLEKSVAPRGLEQAKSSAALREFAGTEALIRFASDFETRHLASMMRVMLQMANWQVKLSGAPDEEADSFFDGITVWYVRDTSYHELRQLPAEDLRTFMKRRDEAIESANRRSDWRGARADALTQQLNASDLSAQTRFVSTEAATATTHLFPPGLSHDAIFVQVGLKPLKPVNERAAPESGRVIMNNR